MPLPARRATRLDNLPSPNHKLKLLAAVARAVKLGAVLESAWAVWREKAREGAARVAPT